MESDASAISGVSARPSDVLIVEDDADMRVMLLQILEMNRCIVRGAGSVRSGEAAIRVRIPDVILCDLHLGPGEPGWKFAERLRHGAETRHVARIAITGRVEPELDVVRAFDAYLRKPLHLALLFDLVRQLTAISRGSCARVAV